MQFFGLCPASLRRASISANPTFFDVDRRHQSLPYIEQMRSHLADILIVYLYTLNPYYCRVRVFICHIDKSFLYALSVPQETEESLSLHAFYKRTLGKNIEYYQRKHDNK